MGGQRVANALSAGRLGRHVVDVTRAGLLLATSASVVLCASVAAAGQGIDVTPVEISTPEGPARGLLAKVDLTDERVSVIVTAPLSSRDGLSPSANATLVDTQAWAVAEDATLAINANYFGWLGKKAAGEPSQIMGLCVSDGVIVSPPRVHEGKPDPALIVVGEGLSRRAQIGRLGLADIAGATHGVAGIGASSTSDLEGSLLLTDGVNTAEQARVEPLVRHPRSAVGVNAEGTTLYVVAIDGRQPAHSVGVTLPELADYLKSVGARNALNLDGGGSTALIYRSRLEDGSVRELTNKPSDGKFRPVAVNLGFRLGLKTGSADEVRDVPKATTQGTGG